MKEYTNSYSGVITQAEDGLWSIDLYKHDVVEQTMTGLEREDDAKAVVTTWVVQEGWTAMDKTEKTDPVDWDDPLFERDFLKHKPTEVKT